MNFKNIALPGLLSALVILCAGYSRVNGQTTPDPGTMGPHSVLKQEYNLGDMSYAPPTAAMFPTNMEERGSVHYPSDLANGPYPVLVWLHGRHSTCYNTSSMAATSAWPCPTGFAAIPSYAGYDYAAKIMASHGYIVISISANCINAKDGALSDAGMNARGVLVQHHLDLWNTWNTAGAAPFGTTFKGALDMKNIGTMGHSRGGEGVIYNAEYNRTLGSPYGIKAILTLAPVDFFRHFVNGIPVMNVAPYCDGDVSDLQGVHFYDDARYPTAPDESPKHNVEMLGANHNFFNTVWTPNPYVGGGGDDWEDYGYNPLDAHCGTTKATRFDTTKQKNAYVAYAAAFYRLYLGHETKFAPILETKDIVPPASSTLSVNDVFVSYHPGKSDRLDVNRTEKASEYTTNTLSGAVTKTGLVFSGICGGGLGMTDCGIGSSPTEEPHSGDFSTLGLGQMDMQWDGATDFYQNDIPQANQNISVYENLQFRAAVDFNLSSSAPSLDYTVQVIDSAGAIGSQTASANTNAMFLEKGTEFGTLPKVVFNTVSMPVAGFTGVDLKKIRKVKFLFDKTAAGAMLISDLAFTNPVCGITNADYKDSIGHGYYVNFTNKSTATGADTISYLWSFGDPTSGTRDTSTLKNPFHKFLKGKGSYTVCLYVKVKRANGQGMVCTDTICNTITLVTSEVTQLGAEQHISIIPNPAKDYLQVSGAEPADVLRLINLYGQVVFTTVLKDPTVRLPENLATGVYYAVVTTANGGNVYQKIVITH